MYIPSQIKNIIADRPFSVDSVGMSDSQVICFDDMVLKSEKQCEASDYEYRMMKWLDGQLPVPRVLGFAQEKGVNYLLMTKAAGDMLCAADILDNQNLLVGLLADSLNALWSVDIADCPYNSTLASRLRLAEYNVSHGLCSTEDAEPETYGKNGLKIPSSCLIG